MANVNYYLKDSQSNRETLIYLFFSFDSFRVKISTGQKVHPDNWNSEKGRVRITRKQLSANEINSYLDHLAEVAKGIYLNAKQGGVSLTVEGFKQNFKETLSPTPSEAPIQLEQFLGRFIEERSKSPKYSPNSIKIYRTTQKHLTEFKGHSKRKEISFEDVDYEFLIEYRDYLYSKGFGDNNIHKLVTTLKTILADAKERGLTDSSRFLTRKPIIEKEEVVKIYLNVEELNSLYQLDLSQNPRLDKVRDLFLIGAFTGLRFSDYQGLKKENIRTINGGLFLELDTFKTGERVTIPVNPMLRTILDKYNGQPPKGLSNQKFNDYLKDLGKVGGLEEVISLTRHEGGLKVNRNYKKWELLTTHTARRSFATNAFKAGVPPISIMKITGHRTETSFMRYIQISKEENAVLLANHPFFLTSAPVLKVVG